MRAGAHATLTHAPRFIVDTLFKVHNMQRGAGGVQWARKMGMAGEMQCCAGCELKVLIYAPVATTAGQLHYRQAHSTICLSSGLLTRGQ